VTETFWKFRDTGRRTYAARTVAAAYPSSVPRQSRRRAIPSQEPSYDPLTRIELGRSVVNALLGRPCGRLPPEPFGGIGVYAIYYHGPFDLYGPISAKDCATPIYVGKAIPRGGRKGLAGLGAHATKELFNRLRDHADSINAAENLDLKDFSCRYLVVDDVWIPLAENLLIAQAPPLWNYVVTGFGSHAVGGKREEGALSAWDTIHPGRPDSKKLAPGKLTRDQIRGRIREFFAKGPTAARGAPET